MEVAESIDDRVATVRSFNRFYTNIIGVLQEGLLDTPYSLTEARIIFELAQREVMEVVDLRRVLDLDPGYVSRIITRFEADDILTKERSALDRRRQVVSLTERGRTVFATLNQRSAEQNHALLARLTEEEQRRLVAAMGTIREILEDAPQPHAFLLRSPGPGDFGWVIHRHGVLYADEYGWDESFEALVARIIADYMHGHDPKRESAWIAEADGEPVGCVLCVKRDGATAQLRLLLVEPRVRGMGIGTRLVEECLRFARRAGYEQIMLWTNDVLEDARRIYERAGFELVEEEKHHSFGHDLVGQNWWRKLR